MAVELFAESLAPGVCSADSAVATACGEAEEGEGLGVPTKQITQPLSEVADWLPAWAVLAFQTESRWEGR